MSVTWTHAPFMRAECCPNVSTPVLAVTGGGSLGLRSRWVMSRRQEHWSLGILSLGGYIIKTNLETLSSFPLPVAPFTLVVTPSF